MAKIFISYRREDNAAFTGRIYDRLVAKYGRNNVFKDVDGIPFGVDFGGYILDSLRQCSVELVVIGSQWVGSRKEDGSRRLDDPDDFVRFEVEAGFSLGLVIVPVLIDNTPVPSAAELPDSLQKLRRINAVQVRNDPDFSHDMDRVVAALERAFASRPGSAVIGEPTALSQEPKMLSQAHTPAPIPRAQAAPTSPVVASSPVVPIAPAQKPIMPKQQSQGLAGLARNRPLVAGIAALLVVIAFAGLLAPIVGSTLAHNAEARQTVVAKANVTASASAVQAATQTAIANVFSYSAAAPAPGCDSGGAVWDDLLDAGTILECSLDHVHVRARQTCSNICSNDAGYRLGSDQAAPFPANYSLSLQIRNLRLGNKGTFGFSVHTSCSCKVAVYYFLFHSTGRYEVITQTMGSDNSFGPAITLANGSVNLITSHILALASNAQTVTIKLDNQVLVSKRESAHPNFVALDISLVGEASPIDLSADLSNLRIQPM